MNYSDVPQLCSVAKCIPQLACKLLLFLAAASAMQIQETNTLGGDRFVRTSSVRSNLTASVVILTPTPTPADMITYGFNSTGTNEIQVYLPPQAHHLCRVEMTNTNGQPLNKTRMAAELNASFFGQTNVFYAGELRRSNRRGGNLHRMSLHRKVKGGQHTIFTNLNNCLRLRSREITSSSWNSKCLNPFIIAPVLLSM